ncbi:MAG: S-adenosyl-l-methionine hydroxide adenosyltransferase family protein [Desulfobacterales bacterium]
MATLRNRFNGFRQGYTGMPVISLLTDFGLSDPYAGIMKAVIASICPEAQTIDISHRVEAQDVAQAAYFLASAYPYFPRETIHVAVVDPGVGSSRLIAAVKTPAGVFLAPDNGVLTHILEQERILAAFRVENHDIFIHPVSRTFHGRDIFAPAAARLACGMEMEKLGARVDAESLIRLDAMPKPEMDEKGRLLGSVAAVDGFGNLVSNIRQSDIEQSFKDKTDICIHAGGRIIPGISESYASAAEGGLLAIIGSTGCLEISVNRGDAAGQLNMGRGGRIIVSSCTQPGRG